MDEIEQSPLFEEAITSCHYFWQAGWGEFHAGNLTYLLDDDEVAELSKYFSHNPVKVPVEFDTCGLEGRYFLATRTGGSFRTLPQRVARDMGIIRLQVITRFFGVMTMERVGQRASCRHIFFATSHD